jgi:hypothetical protein
MAHPLALYSLENSNMPRSQKNSIIRELMGKVGRVKAPSAHHLASTGIKAIAGSGTALVVGGVLGAIHAEAKHGLDMGGHAPADLLLGLAGAGIAAVSENEMTHNVSLVAGFTGFGVFGFREMYGLMAEKKLQKGGTPGGTFKPLLTRVTKPAAAASTAHGDGGDDPILAIAKRRGFNK